MRNLIPIGTAVLLVLPVSARAIDVITVKGAKKRLSGKVTGVTRTKVVIKQLGMTKNTDVPVNAIVKIKWTGEARTLDGIRNAEAGGRYADAIKGYQEQLKSASGNAYLQSDLQYFIARATARSAIGDPTKVDDAIAKLRLFDRQNTNSYHHYELLSILGDLQLSKEAYDAALATFSKLANAPWNDVKLAARCSEARVLLAQNKSTKALEIYNSVLADASKDVLLKSLESTANLGKAAALHQNKDYKGALGALDHVIRTTPVTNAAVMAEAYLLQGDSHRKNGNSKDALLAYLHVDVLFSSQTKYHPKALYHLSQLWAEAGQRIRAGNTKFRLTKTYPNSEWAKK